MKPRRLSVVAVRIVKTAIFVAISDSFDFLLLSFLEEGDEEDEIELFMEVVARAFDSLPFPVAPPLFWIICLEIVEILE